MKNVRIYIKFLTQIYMMYIVLLHLDSIMTDSNSTHITETSREAFCRLVNQRIEKGD